MKLDSDYSGDNDKEIRLCYFYNIRENIVDKCPVKLTIKNCEFYNITIENDYGFYLGEDSYIEYCIFDGVKCNGYGLVGSYKNSPKTPRDTLVFIDDCKFKNCVTKNGNGNIEDFIDLENCETVKTLFKESNEWYTAIELEDCEGIENLDKEGNSAENYVIVKSINGKRIGSDMDIDIIKARIN